MLLDHDETAPPRRGAGAQRIGGGAGRAVRHPRRGVLDAVFQRVRPEVVFHAAAHKHVPILEQYVCEAVRTNVFGTINVLDAARARARRTW